MLLEKVSILIPAYKPNWLASALESALDQDYENIEIIVTDDCPTDEVWQVVSRFPRHIRYEKNTERDGLGYNNAVKALSLANGDYLKFLFDDDLLASDCCSVLKKGLSENSTCSLAFSARHIIDEDSNALAVCSFKTVTSYLDSKETMRKMALSCVNFIGEPTTVMFRRLDYLALGSNGIFELVDSPARALGDVALFMNLAQRGNSFFYCHRPLSSFRKSRSQNSQANSEVRRFAVSEWMDVLAKSMKCGLTSATEATLAASFFREKWLKKYRFDPALQLVVGDAVERFGKLKEMLVQEGDHKIRKCYLCKSDIDYFLPYHGGSRNVSPVMHALRVIGSDVDNYMCPVCRCNDRVRHLVMYMDRMKIWDAVPGAEILHVSPERELEKLIIKLAPRSYRRVDLHPGRPGIEPMDLQALEICDNSISLVICNHVLEHVSDPGRALREIARVLRPGGIAILQTPWSPILRATIEAEVDSDASRELLFGQVDHVRLFGRDFFDCIAESGMQPVRISHQQVLSDLDASLYGVNCQEDLMLAVKREGCKDAQ